MLYTYTSHKSNHKAHIYNRCQNNRFYLEIESNMKTTNKAGKRLRIAEADITALLTSTKMTRGELASLLNINPASLSRWADPRNPQAPTSTTYLVLIPLLLAAGVEILPSPDLAMVQKHLATFKGLGLLKEDELKNEKVKRTLYRAISVLNSEVVEASRRLFSALQEAWKKVDESLLHKR